MWFKQNEPKSPQQPETPAPRPQPPAAHPPAPAQPLETAPAAPPVAATAPTPAAGASRITPGITLKGDISGREDLWIGGNVDGTLRLESSRVVVGASGKIHGEIEAREIVIEGKVEGDLRAAERLEISPTGTVRGDATAPRIAFHEGAVFNGSMEVTRAGESPAVPQRSGGASRASAGARGPRSQNAQAASAAATGGGAVIPVGTPPGVPDPTPESREADAPPAATVLRRGIAADSSERSE